MDLYRIIYCSRNIMKRSGDALVADLKRILATSVRHNKAAGITGSLVFNRDYFVQVLEGTPKVVTRIFSRIMNDPRHTEIMLIEARPIAERAFDAWSMNYAGNATLFDALRKSAKMDGVIDPARIDADDLVTSLHELIQRKSTCPQTQPSSP
jgi:hypothetical protein